MGAANVDPWSENDSARFSRYLLLGYEDDPCDYIERVATQDETWVHHFDTGSKMHSKQNKHPGSPLIRNLRGVNQQWSDGLNLLWYSRGDHDWIARKRMHITQLRKEIVRKRRGKLTYGVLLLQDNDPPPPPPVHTSLWRQVCLGLLYLLMFSSLAGGNKLVYYLLCNEIQSNIDLIKCIYFTAMKI